MKKTTLILLGLVFLISHNALAQTVGELTFEKKYGFEEGLTHAFAIQAGNYDLVLLAINSNEGTINTYSLDSETGAIGDLLFEKKLEKKGNWAVTTSVGSYSQKRFLLISYADRGDMEIYAIERDGSVGEKTWETNSFEKGISIIAPTFHNMLLVKPNIGQAWVFKFNRETGQMEDITWQTTEWDKNIAAGIPAGGNQIALTHPDGKFWLIRMKNNIPEITQSKTGYTKGITTMASNPEASFRIFIANPHTGHQWGLRTPVNITVITDDPNWEKGLTVQTNLRCKYANEEVGYEDTRSLLYVFKPEIGAAWVFKTDK